MVEQVRFPYKRIGNNIYTTTKGLKVMQEMFAEAEMPETMPVVVSQETCWKHGFYFVSMPRNVGGEDYGYKMKCPLRTCPEGK